MQDKKVLIVEDEKQILKLFETILSSVGYEVFVAENAEDSLEIINKNSPNVVFLDLNLPNMNGLELCKKIKINNPTSICFAVTGYTSKYGVIECRKHGFDDYFIKPIDLNILVTAAENAFKTLERWNPTLEM